MNNFSDSDESFTWTKVSNASSISDIESMSPVKLQNGHNDSPKKMNFNKHLEDMAEPITDTVRGKKRKIKQSISTDFEDCNRSKKRKVISYDCHEHNNSDEKEIKQKIIIENSSDYLDIKVKNEELSSSETSPSKSKKKKQKKYNESEDYDEKYLNAQVKQEQTDNLDPIFDGSVKKKKKKHKELDLNNGSEEINEHSLTATVKDESDSTPVKKKKKSKHSVSSNFESPLDTEYIDEHYLNLLVKEEDTFVKPKSKKKNCDSDVPTNTTQTLDDLSEESIVSTPKKKKNRNSESINIESVRENESAKKSKKNKHKHFAVNSEKNDNQESISATSHLESNRLKDNQPTVIKLNNKKSNHSSDTTVDNDRYIGTSEKNTDRRLSSPSTSDDDISTGKKNVSFEDVSDISRSINKANSSRKSSIHKDSISLNKSPHIKSQARNSISKEIVSEDSSSNNESSIENKQKSNNIVKEPNESSPRRKISKGNTISDQSSSVEGKDKSPEPKSTPSRVNKQLNISSNRTVSNSSDSSDENNSIANESKSPKPMSVQLHRNTPRTFSRNYGSSDDSNSDQDKSTKNAKSLPFRKQSPSDGLKRTVSKGSSSDKDRTNVVQNKSVSKSPKKNLRAVSNSVDSSDEDTPSSILDQPKKVTGRSITDRISFEQNDFDATDHDKLDLSSSKLKYFQETNRHLHPIVNKPKSNSVITDDDEIWILKCPHDINVRTLKDTEFLFDKKCKFKMNGETYHGTVENYLEKIAITSFEEKGFVIKNLPLNGVIHVKKRIPKQRVQDDSMLMLMQNQFIPLPETKCRHPFFGADYKKAIKLPKRVAQCLKDLKSEELQSPEQDKRKNKKNKNRLRESHKEEPLEVDIAEETLPEKKKKAKKRKHDDSDEVLTKKTKKKKHKSSEVWDSEKAIEENLFNY